jgi:hypothetical protein
MLLKPIEMNSLDIAHTGAKASKPILDCKSRSHWPDNNTGHLEILLLGGIVSESTLFGTENGGLVAEAAG